MSVAQLLATDLPTDEKYHRLRQIKKSAFLGGTPGGSASRAGMFLAPNRTKTAQSSN